MQGLVNFGKNVGKFKKKEKINSALTRRAAAAEADPAMRERGEWKQKGSEKKKRKRGLRKKYAKEEKGEGI